MTIPPPLAPNASEQIRTTIHHGLGAIAGLGGDLIEHANRIGDVLWSPPRVVIVGRLKAGKSTLVNALIGAPVADTAALEATNVVTVYQNGAPSRAEVVGLDGIRRPLPLTGDAVGDLGIAASQVAYLHRYLPSQAIEELTLIDTPGLATLTVDNDTATRRVLIDGFEQSRTASVDADAAMFLFDSVPRADEMEFLRRLGFTPLNTLGVLSRADSFGEGVLGRRSPLEHAGAHAHKLSAQLADTVAAVVPIAGLIGQTSHTGALTEADAAALHTLADLDPFTLIEILESENPAPLSGPVRDRLLDLLGEYGVVEGRHLAGRGAHVLNSWLVEHSNITPLRRLLGSTLHDFASLHRASRILVELDTLAYAHPARQQVREILDWIRNDPSMSSVLAFRALRALLLADPSAAAAEHLRRVLLGRCNAERVGLAAQSPPHMVYERATEHLTWVAQQSISTRTAAEDAALAELMRTYTLIRSKP
ncbi:MULTISPECIES: GTPase [unclassified Rhodococcus (in: high G+C Gram-positive bacteria)]|uniref:GTPase n=1 Tax=unclassified Rhodococcus (in: high G+C Gram-positive bacteria) TaxID=192944 RepID=UPI003396CB9C